jgi:hypothetical protein
MGVDHGRLYNCGRCNAFQDFPMFAGCSYKVFGIISALNHFKGELAFLCNVFNKVLARKAAIDPHEFQAREIAQSS